MPICYTTQFGWWKERAFVTPEKGAKLFEEYEKVLEKYNIKLLFWAESFGVSEEVMYTVMFKDIKDWEKAQHNPETYQANPLNKTRTIFGLEM